MIRIIAIGKMKEKRLSALADDFLTRARKWCPIEVVELKDSNKNKEGEAILRKLDSISPGLIIAMDEHGKNMSSRDLASVLSKHRSLTFIIGGPDGLSQKVRNRADMELSLSKMTFTHETARFLLAEQVYRGFSINSGHSYHRD
jgi:23S rRNA (pseudouridine1915-N3)-methyltransferase